MGSACTTRIGYALRAVAVLLLASLAQLAHAQKLWPLVLPEQRTMRVRDPSQLQRLVVPDTPSPPTVTEPRADEPVHMVSLDDAIRVALENSAVVRVLLGVTAVSSGRTVYDSAVSNTVIDQQRGVFDPTIGVQNNFSRTETLLGVLDPLNPVQAQIAGIRADSYNLNLGLAQKNVTGGTASFGVLQNPTRFLPGVLPLNPQNTPQLNLGYTQPLLQGGGVRANVAPIVIARINTELSYFQFKDAMQDMVRGVAEAYWSVVFARTDVWARQQQVDQGRAAYERAAGRLRQGIGNTAEVAQTRSAWANFRATLIGSRANLLQREAVLRNILGLPPTEPFRIVPVTFPNRDRLQPDWNPLVTLAAERRPDLVELKLIIEADQQQVIIANNQALPQLNGLALYSWNGLNGTTPTGDFISQTPDQLKNWTLGVNFSVPIGLRTGRAALRQSELVLSRDRANLQQGLHATLHILAANVRNLSQYYEQYLAYKDTREAARLNLEKQLAENYVGRAIFLNVLQAITDWGNAVSAEANALAQYNTELANLERQTGTILETHGIRFVEERFGSIGPLGRLALPIAYPQRLPPTENVDRYPKSDKPSETSFDLENPAARRRVRRPAEPPQDQLPDPPRLPPAIP
jgi:outer membrane protein TolC